MKQDIKSIENKEIEDFLSKMIMCIMWHLSFVSNRHIHTEK